MAFKDLLKLHNYTQQRLAEDLNLTQVAVSKWVRGVSVPSKANMFKIATVLNTDVLLVIQSFYN